MAAAYGPQGLGTIPEPAMSEGDDPDDWGLSQGDSDSEETTMEGTPTDIDPNSLLGAYRLQFSEDVGPPLEKEVADTVNAIWSERRDPKIVKQIGEKYPKPANVCCQKVDINSDVLNGISKTIRARDTKLRAIQGSIAKSALPAVKMVEGLLAKDTAKSEMVERALDMVTLLANANSQINQFRRDALKPGLQVKYQSLCQPEPSTDCSQLLLGNNLNERIKNATQSTKITRKFPAGNQGFLAMRGRRGGFHPYAMTRVGGATAMATNTWHAGDPGLF